jgi:nitrate reductase NapE component
LPVLFSHAPIMSYDRDYRSSSSAYGGSSSRYDDRGSSSRYDERAPPRAAYDDRRGGYDDRRMDRSEEGNGEEMHTRVKMHFFAFIFLLLTPVLVCAALPAHGFFCVRLNCAPVLQCAASSADGRSWSSLCLQHWTRRCAGIGTSVRQVWTHHRHCTQTRSDTHADADATGSTTA